MAERRALVEGLKTPSNPPVDPETEKKFVFRDKAEAAAEANATAGPAPTPTTAGPVSRIPLSTRMRSDFAAALKRASLERQLAGVEPNTLQDILEQAVEPWLRGNGYLK
ncbi:hypothetical protein AB1L88_16705 [Tautonia sp. JC769]|uniref:hypothetical protein n=1 Tax=Tautonia sp. JC769 TaxID=3232135 RepID=UPI0034575BCA